MSDSLVKSQKSCLMLVKIGFWVRSGVRFRVCRRPVKNCQPGLVSRPRGRYCTARQQSHTLVNVMLQRAGCCGSQPWRQVKAAASMPLSMGALGADERPPRSSVRLSDELTTALPSCNGCRLSFGGSCMRTCATLHAASHAIRTCLCCCLCCIVNSCRVLYMLLPSL